MLGRRRPVIVTTVIAVGLLVFAGTQLVSRVTSTSPPAVTPPPLAFNVIAYGADPTGAHDSSGDIGKAIAAATAKSGSTVYFPAGTFLLDDNNGVAADFKLVGSTAPNILGAGRDATKIVEKVGTLAYPNIAKPKTVFTLSQVSGASLGDLTIDTQTYNAGDTVDDFGDNTTIHDARFLGAQNANTFTLRVIAVCNQNAGHTGYNNYHSNNVIKNIILDGRGTGGNDDLDFSCERNGTISNVVDTGWGMALYIDQNVTITNYMFTPGKYEKSPPGWFITDSSRITINNFVTSGAGGIIKNQNFHTTDTVINSEVMTDPTGVLSVDDANNTTITKSKLGVLRIEPTVSTSGLTLSLSTYASLLCSPHQGATITGLVGLRCP